jgi:hypothetical protein
MTGAFLRTYFASAVGQAAPRGLAFLAFCAFFAMLPHTRGYSLSTSFAYSTISGQDTPGGRRARVVSDTFCEVSEVSDTAMCVRDRRDRAGGVGTTAGTEAGIGGANSRGPRLSLFWVSGFRGHGDAASSAGAIWRRAARRTAGGRAHHVALGRESAGRADPPPLSPDHALPRSHGLCRFLVGGHQAGRPSTPRPWLSPLFMGCLGEPTKGCSRQAPPFGAPQDQAHGGHIVASGDAG